MSIRSESMPYRGELSYQLQDLLRRNGMKAQLVVEQDQYKLLVQGHDSPLLEYPINEKQLRLSLTVEPTMPTRMPTRRLTTSSERISICRHPMWQQEMSTVVLPWDFMVIEKDFMSAIPIFRHTPLGGIF